jgi:NitT/TauT family transport system ATP-binding protein
LFRLIAGLEQADSGAIDGNITGVGYLFQEDRLCEEYSAVKNIELVTGSAYVAGEALKELLDAEDIEKPCKELSGGMKRRVALVRAMVMGADLILLDEPYNGLDEENRAKVTNYLETKGKDSIVLIATHIR